MLPAPRTQRLTKMTEQEQRAAVVAEAKTWRGTPFAHQGRVKGRKGGVDCGQIIACTFENAGITQPIQPKPYMFQHHMHSSREDYAAVILEYAAEIAEADAKAGDIVLYKCGRTFSHGGILVEDWPGLIIHSRTGLGVEYAHGLKNGFLKGREKRFFSHWIANENYENKRGG